MAQRQNLILGTLYARNSRWWWKVQLPGEQKPVARPLKPAGSKYATTDYAVAVECARCLLETHLFRNNAQHQQPVKTIAGLVGAYLSYARAYYVDPQGKPTLEPRDIQYSLAVLLELFPTIPVEEFGPLRLKTVREAMIGRQWCRNLINHRIGIIRRMFKWAVSEQIISPMILYSLQAVTSLRRGRTRAKESRPVRPIDEQYVYAVLPYTTPVMAAMIELQLLTGMRPGELLSMRPCDIDRSGPVWHYYPEKHKNIYRNIERIVSIGPRGQALLRLFLFRNPDAFCFSPAESEIQRRLLLTENRKTPASCGNIVGSNRKDTPLRTPGKKYDPAGYRKAVQYAITACNNRRRAEAKAAGSKANLVPHWTPYQLRHTAATKVRKEMGYETAGAALGHTNMSATAIYAERNQWLADEAARRFG